MTCGTVCPQLHTSSSFHWTPPAVCRTPCAVSLRSGTPCPAPCADWSLWVTKETVEIIGMIPKTQVLCLFLIIKYLLRNHKAIYTIIVHQTQQHCLHQTQQHCHFFYFSLMPFSGRLRIQLGGQRRCGKEGRVSLAPREWEVEMPSKNVDRLTGLPA